MNEEAKKTLTSNPSFY